jgi:molecular chaperone HtpG
MQKDQKAIYYITAETYESAKGSPHLEIFNQKDLVLQMNGAPK